MGDKTDPIHSLESDKLTIFKVCTSSVSDDAFAFIISGYI